MTNDITAGYGSKISLKIKLYLKKQLKHPFSTFKKVEWKPLGPSENDENTKYIPELNSWIKS